MDADGRPTCSARASSRSPSSVRAASSTTRGARIESCARCFRSGISAVATADARLPTKSVRICTSCGAGHFDDEASMCHACGASLGDAEIVNHIYRIENVATQPAERITANDEERQRQGFELQTTFEWAMRDHELDVRQGVGDR